MKRAIQTIVSGYLACSLGCGAEQQKTLEAILEDGSCASGEAQERLIGDPSTREEMALHTYFNDVTDDKGLAGVYSETFSFGDFNYDGAPDFAAIPREQPPQLYIQCNGRFHQVPVLKNYGRDPIGYGTIIKGSSSKAVDIDGDGDQDLITGFTGENNYALVSYNGPGLQFISEQLFFDRSLGLVSSIGTVDFDRDNDLDVYITRIGSGEKEGEQSLKGTGKSNVYLANINGQRIEDVTGKLPPAVATAGGFDTFAYTYMTRSGVTNEDNLPAEPVLWIGNDLSPNAAFIDNGDFTFTKIVSRYINDLQSTMGLDYSYENNTGNLLIAATQTYRIGLVRITASGQVTNESHRINGFDQNHIWWGTVFGDFDNDGDEDLILAPGYLNDTRPVGSNPLYGQKDTLFYFENDGLSFVNKSNSAGSLFDGTVIANYYSLSVGDYNGDGCLDIAVTGYDIQNYGEGKFGPPVYDSPVRLLENACAYPGHWVIFSMDDSYNGSRIELRSGNTERSRELKMSQSVGSGSQLIMHFGLGDTTTIDEATLFTRQGERVPLDITHIQTGQYNQIQKLID